MPADTTVSAWIRRSSKRAASRPVELRADVVSGTNLRVGADVKGGLQALIGLGRNRRNLQVRRSVPTSLRLAGVAHKYSGLKVEEVLVDALDAKASVKDGVSTLGIAAKNIEVKGVNWLLTERVLEMQRDKLLGKPEQSRTKADKAQLESIESLLDAMRAAKETLADTAQRLMDPKLPEAERQRYEQQKVDAERELAHWQQKVELRRLGVRDLNIDVQGLGDVLADDYSIDRALASKEGITIAGKGPGGQIVSGVSAEGAAMRLSAAPRGRHQGRHPHHCREPGRGRVDRHGADPR